MVHIHILLILSQIGPVFLMNRVDTYAFDLSFFGF